jgi:hypothetical protein
MVSLNNDFSFCVDLVVGLMSYRGFFFFFFSFCRSVCVFDCVQVGWIWRVSRIQWANTIRMKGQWQDMTEIDVVEREQENKNQAEKHSIHVLRE